MLTISDHWINQTAIVRTLAGLFAAMVLAQTQECGLAFPNDSTAVTVKVSIPYKGRSFKVSNHVLLVFQRNWSDKGKNNVELFSRSGKRLGSLNSLAAVKDAKDMSIWDAAVGPQGQLALAVVSADGRGRPSAHLLLYDSAGRFLHALSLPPDRMIRKLDVDEENKIWALGEKLATKIRHQDSWFSNTAGGANSRVSIYARGTFRP